MKTTSRTKWRIFHIQTIQCRPGVKCRLQTADFLSMHRVISIIDANRKLSNLGIIQANRSENLHSG